MNRIMMRSLFMLMAMMIMAVSCNKDEDPLSLQGSYTRQQALSTGTYQVYLEFTTDGHLIWTPDESAQGHSPSQVSYQLLEGNRFRIYEDDQCESEAVYSYERSKTTLQLSHIEDDCTARVNALSGIWSVQ